MRTTAAVLGIAVIALTQSLAAAENPIVRLTTTLGEINIELYPEQAPRSVANFLTLVDGGFYEGLVFHRVIAGFVVQAGGYDADLRYRDPPAKVVNESIGGLKNRRLSVAMARLEHPDSADTQFFINVADNTHLDAAADQPGYTVFGQVVLGEEVVEAIELVDTHVEAGMAGVPESDVVILKAERL